MCLFLRQLYRYGLVAGASLAFLFYTIQIVLSILFACNRVAPLTFVITCFWLSTLLLSLVLILSIRLFYAPDQRGEIRPAPLLRRGRWTFSCNPNYGRLVPLGFDSTPV